MTKVKMSEANVPPMPGIQEDVLGSSSQSISGEGESPAAAQAVDESFAGELINLPFEGWALFETRVPKELIVLSDRQKAFYGGPVARILEKYGLGKIAKDEIVVISGLTIHTIAVIWAIRKARNEAKLSTTPPEKAAHPQVQEGGQQK